jgi:hypothetical protein
MPRRTLLTLLLPTVVNPMASLLQRADTLSLSLLPCVLTSTPLQATMLHCHINTHLEGGLR